MGAGPQEKEHCKMLEKKASGNDKWRYTLYTTILFLIIVNPMTYKLVNMLLGSLVKICDSKGCPTYAGILIHAIVFTFLLRYMMDLDI
mgnify:CR=1 FL=1|jgi:hypothetical protein|tara:strand:- start:196 stop:459 length:264 start_codon:yes stop_codon:yes gene_type:complete